MANTQVLEQHLKYNHYPPVSPKIIPYAQIALERAEAGDWDTEITIKGDNDSLTVTVRKLVDDLHLHDLLDPYDPKEGL